MPRWVNTQISMPLGQRLSLKLDVRMFRCNVRGLGRSPKKFTPNLIFLNLKPVQNFITLEQPLLGEKYVAEKRKKKIIPTTKYSGHFAPQQHPRAAHALRSDQYQFYHDIINCILERRAWTCTKWQLFNSKVIINKFTYNDVV